ncbi:MAG: sugar porter family MFS transporter [Euryarchaeota archaeon]|nr:sugar porter family MFS transporter [Euryarchaeota archaeon]
MNPTTGDNNPVKLNLYLLRSALVAALGGLLFGFDTAVISGATKALTEAYGLSPGMLGFTVSSALWGTVLGSIFAGYPSDRFGRRAALRALSVFYVVSAVGCALAWDWYSLVFFRVIGGLAIGGSSVIGPMYIAEIAPAARRGRLVAMFQFNIVLGILLAYFSNYLVGLAGFGASEWRWKLGVAAAPAILFFFALFGIPQSPRWLARRGRQAEAREVLVRVGERDVDGELRDILATVSGQSAGGSVPLFQRRYRLPVFLAIAIGMFNQLTGINAILYYLNDIFERAGFSKVSSDLQAVAIGFTNLVFTLIAMSLIDRLGRKKLLLVGAVGTASCLAGVSFVFFTGMYQGMLLWLLVLFIAFFAFSQGSVIWVYLSEVFPNLVRAKGQSLGSFTHWFMNALISGIFPMMAAASGGVPFAFFALMTVVQFFVVLTLFPETKGISLEDLERKMDADHATKL